MELAGIIAAGVDLGGHGTDMIEIRDHFRKIADLLKAKADVAGGTGHASTTGNLREQIVKDFLRPHLPRTFNILAGVVLDLRRDDQATAVEKAKSNRPMETIYRPRSPNIP